jgi:hypothetical protein
LVKYVVNYQAKNGVIHEDQFKQSAALIMQAVNRLANRERVERKVVGLRRPKRGPYLVGDPPFMTFVETLKNEEDPFFKQLLNHPSIRGSMGKLQGLLKGTTEVSRKFIISFFLMFLNFWGSGNVCRD